MSLHLEVASFFREQLTDGDGLLLVVSEEITDVRVTLLLRCSGDGSLYS
jgi:hypothetical protein